MKSNLDLAAELAHGGRDRTYRLACVSKRSDGTTVSAVNSRMATPHPRAHAEARALRKSDKGSTIWIARIDDSGSWRLAKPCKHCQRLIRNKRVDRVYYTIGPGEFGVWYPGKKKRA